MLSVWNAWKAWFSRVETFSRYLDRSHYSDHEIQFDDVLRMMLLKNCYNYVGTFVVVYGGGGYLCGEKEARHYV